MSYRNLLANWQKSKQINKGKIMDSLTLKGFIFILVQAVLVTSVIVSNRNHVTQLKEQNTELKQWLVKLQETVTNLRVKVGQK